MFEEAKAALETDLVKEDRREKMMHELQSDKNVICISLSGEDLDLKQEAMNHMLINRYVCVQNDFAHNGFGVICHIITFAKEGFAEKFKN